LRVDERQLLGRAILSVLAELREPGRMEAFLLYLGRENEPVVIHRRQTRSRDDDSIQEMFTLNANGVLHYEWIGPGRSESSRGRDELGIPLRVEKDFTGLDYESVLALHEVVTREDFFDLVAYRIDRNGRVGYGNVYALDPDEEGRKSRKARLQ
jgi:hypothetical protein